jgi:hypothetical protein
MVVKVATWRDYTHAEHISMTITQRLLSVSTQTLHPHVACSRIGSFNSRVNRRAMLLLIKTGAEGIGRLTNECQEVYQDIPKRL